MTGLANIYNRPLLNNANIYGWLKVKLLLAECFFYREGQASTSNPPNFKNTKNVWNNVIVFIFLLCTSLLGYGYTIYSKK